MAGRDRSTWGLITPARKNVSRMDLQVRPARTWRSVLRHLLCRRGNTVTAASLSAVLLLAGAVVSQEKTAQPTRILFPPDHAVLLSGHFDVIVRAEKADLVIDGRPQAWEAFAPPVHVLHVSLDPGPHKLEAAGQTREFVVTRYIDDPAAPRVGRPSAAIRSLRGRTLRRLSPVEPPRRPTRAGRVERPPGLLRVPPQGRRRCGPRPAFRSAGILPDLSRLARFQPQELL